MSNTAIIFGLLAAVLWGLSPVLSKRGFTTGGTPLLATLALVTFGTVGLWALTFVIHEIDTVVAGLSPAVAGAFVLGGVIGTGVGRLLNYSGVKALGASVNSAGVATDPVFAVGLGVIMLGESVTPTQLFGVCVVVVGLGITILSGGGNNRGWPLRALIIPLGAAFAYGSGAVIRRFGLVSTTISPIQAAALNETAALVAIIGYAAFNLNRETLTNTKLDSYVYLIAAGIVNTLGVVSFFISIDNGPVVIGSTLAGMSTLITVGTSAVFLNRVETVTKTTIAGAVVTVVGASLAV